MSSAPRLRLTLQPSRAFAVLVLAAHAAAGACAVLGLGGGPMGLAAGGLLVLLGAITARRVALLGDPASPVRLILSPDGAWTAECRGGGTRSGCAPRRRVTPWWVSIPAPGGGLLVVRGMAASEDFRRLRIWALWSGPGSRESVP